MRFLRRLSITTRIAVGSLVVAIIFVAGGAVVVRLSVESIVHNATVTLLKHDAAAYLPAPGQAPTESAVKTATTVPTSNSSPSSTRRTLPRIRPCRVR